MYGPTVDEPSAVTVPLSLPSAAFFRFGLVAAAANDASTPTSATTPTATAARRSPEEDFMYPNPLFSIAAMRPERDESRGLRGLFPGERSVAKW